MGIYQQILPLTIAMMITAGSGETRMALGGFSHAEGGRRTSCFAAPAADGNPGHDG
jgi:hypothetical protein